MALLAGFWNPQCDVIRITCPLEVRHMAADAGCGRSLVLSARVACSAIESCVHAGQREAGVPEVIKLDAQPGIDRVALFALCREAGGDVIGPSRLLICVLMARITLDR